MKFLPNICYLSKPSDSTCTPGHSYTHAESLHNNKRVIMVKDTFRKQFFYYVFFFSDFCKTRYINLFVKYILYDPDETLNHSWNHYSGIEIASKIKSLNDLPEVIMTNIIIVNSLNWFQLFI